eukprot:CAMPEP_0196678246 /NCGR_PEP_ID=MMETSP1090-20130531/6212_1 /TAXON_ID=37098 /ORGANISM="Isochrysis sp, Strain CCMP1244" /LENGTH=154 /DNA_ID=CAMNT_0042016379 /DNA_START=111 /DNA_END=570 /DNA_ORIENTATION=+
MCTAELSRRSERDDASSPSAGHSSIGSSGDADTPPLLAVFLGPPVHVLVLVRTALLDAPIQQRLGRGGSGRHERAARLEHQLGRDGDGRCDGRPEAVQVHLAVPLEQLAGATEQGRRACSARDEEVIGAAERGHILRQGNERRVRVAAARTAAS